MHQLGSREEAEDAVQTTFMNAFRALGRGVVPEAESAWLFKIAENVCLSRRRSSWRRGRIESPSDFDVIEEIVPGPSRQRDELIGIEDALASMPEQQRRAILLREWQGLSYREIAAELEVSQSAVETLIFRARRSLAQGLEQPDTVKPKRKSFRRALHMIDLGTIAAAAKTLLAGSAAVKATAAAVAVTAAAGTAATVAPKLERQPPAKAPVAVVAPVAAESSTSSNATVTFAAAAPVTELVSKAPAATRAATKKPAVVSRSAPARGVPVTVVPDPAAPVAVEPDAPAAEPTPAEQTAVQQQAEAAPAPAPAQQTDEGKQDEGKKNEGKHKGRGPEAPAAPVLDPAAAPSGQAAPVERRGGHAKGKKDDAPAPASVTAPAAVEETKHDSKKDRGRGNDKRELTVAPSLTPTPDPVVAETLPVPTAPVAGTPAAAPEAAPTAEPSDKGSSDKGNGNGKRKG
jgi:RNA polymerase sigma factor (sigma-70 family)